MFRGPWPFVFSRKLMARWGMIDIMTQGVLDEDVGRVFRFIFKISTLTMLAGPLPRSGRSFDPLFFFFLCHGGFGHPLVDLATRDIPSPSRVNVSWPLSIENPGARQR